MECNFDIDVIKPDSSKHKFSPYVKFKLTQLNMSPDCYTDIEIDEQIKLLIGKAKELGELAKRKLKTSK